jgi:hypothetical protein
MRDYSQPGDPYGISEMTAQSADGDMRDRPRVSSGGVDVRGCTLLAPRRLPTQAEADAIKGEL